MYITRNCFNSKLIGNDRFNPVSIFLASTSHFDLRFWSWQHAFRFERKFTVLKLAVYEMWSFQDPCLSYLSAAQASLNDIQVGRAMARARPQKFIVSCEFAITSWSQTIEETQIYGSARLRPSVQCALSMMKIVSCVWKSQGAVYYSHRSE